MPGLGASWAALGQAGRQGAGAVQHGVPVGRRSGGPGSAPGGQNPPHLGSGVLQVVSEAGDPVVGFAVVEPGADGRGGAVGGLGGLDLAGVGSASWC
jgi:hypothetical protein